MNLYFPLFESVVRTEFDNRWRKNEKPVLLNELRFRIALKAFHNRMVVDAACQHHKFSLEERKITPYVKRHIFKFIKIYKSLFSPKERETNLAIGGHCFTESMIDEMSMAKASRVYLYLKKAYSVDCNYDAGYPLLYMIKKIGGCSFEIPDKSVFNSTTVQRVLSGAISSCQILHKKRLIELLHKELSSTFLQGEADRFLLELTLSNLKDIHLSEWPEKKRIITTLLNNVQNNRKLLIANALNESPDPQTNLIGSYLIKAFHTPNSLETILSFHALKELLPCLDFKAVFRFPYITLCNKTDGNLKYLNFNVTDQQIFVVGSLIIGVYFSHDISESYNKTPSYLLAFDKESEKLVWGIPHAPISSSGYYLNERTEECTIELIGNHLYRNFHDSKEVEVIDTTNGSLVSTFELPYLSNLLAVYFCEEGYVYQLYQNEDKENRTLIGGKIVNNILSSCFSKIVSDYSLELLSTHFKYNNTLISPTGDEINFPMDRVRSVLAKGNKLYTIENETTTTYEENYILKIRTLKCSKEVVSDVEKAVLLPEDAYFGTILESGNLILFSIENQSPIFINIKDDSIHVIQDDQINFSDAFSQTVVNEKSGEVWYLDDTTGKLWKISAENKVLMGTFDLNKDAPRLLHVDGKDRLYVMRLNN